MNRFKMVMLVILLIIGITGLFASKQSNNLEETGKDISKPQTTIVLYYINPIKGELTKEFRNVDLEKVQKNIAETIVEELLKGPENSELVQKIPKGTQINKIKISQNKITVDFSKEFIEVEDNEIDKLDKIYSVVNSLTEIKEINEVEITVEGKNYATKKRL